MLREPLTHNLHYTEIYRPHIKYVPFKKNLPFLYKAETFLFIQAYQSQFLRNFVWHFVRESCIKLQFGSAKPNPTGLQINSKKQNDFDIINLLHAH